MKIIWTDFAIENLKGIYDFYAQKAGKKIANKIKLKIFESTKQLLKNPESGQLELSLENLQQNHRYLVSGNYKIIYRLFDNQIAIVDIFDTRQEPKKILDENRNKN